MDREGKTVRDTDNMRGMLQRTTSKARVPDTVMKNWFLPKVRCNKVDLQLLRFITDAGKHRSAGEALRAAIKRAARAYCNQLGIDKANSLLKQLGLEWSDLE